jgi:hypothetical protein
MTVDRRIALSGIPPASVLLTWEKMWWKGIAASLAKLQVARDAAQEMEMAQNMPIPKTFPIIYQIERIIERETD